MLFIPHARRDGASERQVAPWKPTRELRVASVQGVTIEAGANWTKLWEKATGCGAAAFKCSSADCASNALDCAHVWVEGLAHGRVVGVVPLCGDHMNHKKHPCPTAMVLRVGTNVMLMNAHTAYKADAVQAGERCLPSYLWGAMRVHNVLHAQCPCPVSFKPLLCRCVTLNANRSRPQRYALAGLMGWVGWAGAGAAAHVHLVRLLGDAMGRNGSCLGANPL